MLNSLNLLCNPNKVTGKDPALTAATMEKLKTTGEARRELVERVSWVKLFEGCARFLDHITMISVEPYSRFDNKQIDMFQRA